jgi:hypothetical protein
MKQSRAVRIPGQTSAEKPEKDLRFLGAAALEPFTGRLPSSCANILRD